NGYSLCTGADSRLCVVKISTMEVQQEIKDVFCGPVTAICWVEFDGRKDEGFAYGCCNGAIHVYKWSAIAARYVFVSMIDAHPAQVQAVEFNTRFRRIASIGDGTPKVWKLDSQGHLHPIIDNFPRSQYIGRSIHFVDDGASVVATYLESHEVCVVSGEVQRHVAHFREQDLLHH
ncbi:hypothetical protein FOMPIDRAFT_42700, partial [Fomitopsis schrenkii]